MSLRFLELYRDSISFQGQSMETIESEELKQAHQSYSISFWLYLNRAEKNKQVTVIHKGNTFSSNPLIAIQERTLYIKIDIDRSRSEMLFSSIDIPIKKWVHIVFTLKSSDIIEASLYINGTKDSEISISQSRDLDQNSPSTKIYIGKDPWNHGLYGSVAEPVYYFTNLDLSLISNVFYSGLNNWQTNKKFATTKIIYESQDRASSTLPPRLLSARTPTSQKKQGMRSVTPLTLEQKLDNFFDNNPSTYSKVAEMVNSYEWLLVIYRILRSSMPVYRDDEGNLENKLEVDRMIPPLKQMQLNFTRNELVDMAKIMKCHSQVTYDKIQPWKNIEIDDIIQYADFLEGLKRHVDSLELGDFSLVSKDDIDNIERRNILLNRADEWYSARSGNFEICIDFCANCRRHQTSTWHNSNEYIEWYNIVYKDINDEFPGITIIGNKYGPPTIGIFAVYLEYLGAEGGLDKFGRLKVYKRKNLKPNSREILDSLYLIAYLFNDTSEVGEAQNDFKRRYGEKERHSESLTGMGQVSIEIKPKTQGKTVTELDSETEMFCRNWGCLKKLYLYGKNHKKACLYHPGRWEFGSVHGLWPENWTCCRGSWESQGCTHGFHNGVINQQVMKKCINRGELSAKSGRPDSVCGMSFPDPATCGKKYQIKSDCRYHTGHAECLGKNTYVWTCCNAEFNPNFPDDSFCVEGDHRFAEWPDEEAKIYFVTKSLNKKGRTSFHDSAKTSRFFNSDIKPYVNPYLVKKEKEALENENRYCLNWACESVYKEIDNNDKACKCHTGYWDFGHSGILKGKETIVLWEPHWRCCGGKWEDVGCTLIRHNGPLVAKMEERKWRWPSEGAKRMFLKKISHLWQRKLDSEHLSRKEVSQKYDSFCSEISSKILPSNMLHRFTLILHLHILCVSEDLSFMFKYQDVISKQAESLLSNKQGYIDKETFLEWWFAPLERIRPEMALT
ncbi:hypothetical protein SteCoe_22380 [Stentor coeruleus]|uniref:Uncharacterized protein n=1 Tax=Stentor coeruleus TaxID=5963 RepID=A0A1R2BMF9_9CILI|nr:hypothetical protein SteCoe_22380 [Stentor coeruleus]